MQSQPLLYFRIFLYPSLFFVGLKSLFLKYFTFKMDTETEPIPIEPTKKVSMKTRCTAKTIKGRVCRNKRDTDCIYCKIHIEKNRVRIPVYHVPSEAFVDINELRPCPHCHSNITYGEACLPCRNYIAY